ncbi:signal peptidase I [Bacillus siamensis]|uniref:signal peptidase I n=1 Tax=Bacillus siamensis TaxID=659243 RepID=UPI000648ECCE|nr:signal peptidase I [Bacillus siamensis]MDU0811653.1 signal peptidase I [Bacillus siamensis]MED5049636.1 signal peptidase I [Bacillus siamensis]MED5097854.1 signal peptidase I [Bacillus siamensis]
MGGNHLKSEKEKTSKKSAVLDWAKAIIIAVVLATIIKNFLFAPYLVDGRSMEPTLHDRERIFVNMTVKYISDFKRGQIVVLNGENEHYVKRIIGLPGDTVEMKNDQLYINGKKVSEPYLAANKKKAKQGGFDRLTEDFGPVKVPDDKYFVMGDNRRESMDSRNGLGLFTKKQIAGTSKFVFFPFNEIRKTK